MTRRDTPTVPAGCPDERAHDCAADAWGLDAPAYQPPPPASARVRASIRAESSVVKVSRPVWSPTTLGETPLSASRFFRRFRPR